MRNHASLIIVDKKNKSVLLLDSPKLVSAKITALESIIGENETDVETAQKIFRTVSNDKFPVFKPLGNQINKNKDLVHVFTCNTDLSQFNELISSPVLKVFSIKELHRESLAGNLENGLWEVLMAEGLLKEFKKPKPLQKMSF